MGFLDKLATWLNLKRQEAYILCIGLDNSGKSTIINKLKPAQVRSDTTLYHIALTDPGRPMLGVKFHCLKSQCRSLVSASRNTPCGQAVSPR